MKSPKDDPPPNADNGTVRKYRTEKEVEELIAQAKRNRWGARDAAMILLAYRHGLRVSELCALRWDQVELDAGRIHVRRAKGGTPSTHPLTGVEIRALRALRREWPDHRAIEDGESYSHPRSRRVASSEPLMAVLGCPSRMAALAHGGYQTPVPN
jgi:integrase